MTEQSGAPQVPTGVPAPGNIQVATLGDRVLARAIDVLICVAAFLALWGPAELIAHPVINTPKHHGSDVARRLTTPFPRFHVGRTDAARSEHQPSCR